jgi:hypothetical protein
MAFCKLSEHVYMLVVSTMNRMNMFYVFVWSQYDGSNIFCSSRITNLNSCLSLIVPQNGESTKHKAQSTKHKAHTALSHNQASSTGEIGIV